MNVLVIGGTGAIGSAVASRLSEREDRVTVVSFDSKSARNLPLETTHITADRTSESFPHALQAACGRLEFDFVIDCIGYRGSDASRVLSLPCCRRAHIVMISTTYLYDEDGEIPHAPNCALASADRLGGYALGKLEAETTYASAGDRPITVLRFPHVLVGGRPLGVVPLHNRDPELLARIGAGEPLLLAGGGYQLTQVIWHADAADAIVLVVHDNAPRGGTYNVAHPCILTARQYYGIIAKALGGGDIRVREVPIEPILQSKWGWGRSVFSRIVDSSAFTERFNWYPRIHPTKAIEECVSSLAASGALQVSRRDHLNEVSRVRALGTSAVRSALDEAAKRRDESEIGRRMNRLPLPDYNRID